MSTIVHAPSCKICRQPVGPDGKVVRLRGKVYAHLCARDATLLVVSAATARKYGTAFLRGFLRSHYPTGFKVAQDLYRAVVDARAEVSAMPGMGGVSP